MVRRSLILAAFVLVASGAAHAADVDQAMSQFKSGRYLEAAAAFQSMVQAAPTYDFGWFMLGYCLVKTKRPAEAEEMFRRSIALSPDRAEYYHGLALALKEGGKFGASIDVLNAEEPHAREPRHRFALLSLRGYLYASLQRWDEAVADLEAARAIKDDTDVLDMLARAYVAIGRDDRAVAALDRSLEFEPGNLDNREALAEALLRVAQATADPPRKRLVYGRALEEAQRLASAKPNSADVQNLVGRAALGAARLEVAEPAFGHVLDLDGKNCYAMVNLARVWIARAVFGPAEQMLQRAAACAPRLSAVHETFGLLFLRTGRWSDALEAFHRADRLQPSALARAGMAEAAARMDGEAPPETGDGTTRVGGPVPRR